jgi:hypothetical protein
MLIYAVFVFAAAALIGLLLASSVLRGKFAPWGLSLLHAALGATGLVMLLLTVFDGEGGLVLIGFIILLVAALGGFYLAYRHLNLQVAPGGIVIVHAGAAVAGFLLIAGLAFGLL